MATLWNSHPRLFSKASPPIHLVWREASCCRGLVWLVNVSFTKSGTDRPGLSQRGLFINNPHCSALTGTAWQAAGFAGDNAITYHKTPLMLLTMNAMADCLTLKSTLTFTENKSCLVSVWVSTFQSRTIRRGIYWEKHQRSPKQVMALFTGQTPLLAKQCLSGWTQWG